MKLVYEIHNAIELFMHNNRYLPLTASNIFTLYFDILLNPLTIIDTTVE